MQRDSPRNEIDRNQREALIQVWFSQIYIIIESRDALTDPNRHPQGIIGWVPIVRIGEDESIFRPAGLVQRQLGRSIEEC
jgi:hypothetical protein